MGEACEWNPDRNRPAWEGDPHHGDAVVCLGRKPRWHLCESCAALPRFKRYRKRKPLRKWAQPATETPDADTGTKILDLFEALKKSLSGGEHG